MSKLTFTHTLTQIEKQSKKLRNMENKLKAKNKTVLERKSILKNLK